MNRFAAVALLAVAACGAVSAPSRRDERLRASLDAAEIRQPLVKVWPAVLKLLADHRLQLVGQDRRAVGAAPAPALKRLTAGGFETGRTEDGLALETMEDANATRYRADGLDLGGSACRVRFVVIRRTGGSPSLERSRDLDLELELVRRVDPDEATRIVRDLDAAPR